MADRKIPCADCEDCVPCEMVERCVKHDPAPPTFDNYTRLTTPTGTHIEACPVCAADPEVWQYIAKEGDVAQKVVMCSHDDEIGPHDALAGGGCPLYMPPQSFYRPTIREAVKHWNEYGKALAALRRKNGWKRAKVLRGSAAAGVPACEPSMPPGSVDEMLEWIESMTDDAPIANMARAARVKLASGVQETELWQCTQCGRIGSVGRCCGLETRRPYIAGAKTVDGEQR